MQAFYVIYSTYYVKNKNIRQNIPFSNSFIVYLLISHLLNYSTKSVLIYYLRHSIIILDRGEIKMKTCKKCKQTKKLTEFYDHKTNIDRKQNICKQCFNEYGKEYRKKTKNSRLKTWYQRKQDANPFYARNKQRKWRESNPSKHRNTFLYYKYGITLDEYNRILAQQNNQCKICHIDQKLTGRLLQVDYNHQIKEVRGLVCAKCNQMIGRYKDDPNYIKLQISLLENIIKYLRESF